MFTTDLEYIYVTRDSFCGSISAWDTNIGIKKFKGCCFFASAKYNPKARCNNYCVGNLSHSLTPEDVGGDVPRGTAWLVHVSSGVWKRVDQDMALHSECTGRVING